MPVNTPLATAILVPIDAMDDPIPSFTILPLFLQQLEKVVESPAGRQRTPRPEKISIVPMRSEEHTSELQSLMRISYAVLSLQQTINHHITTHHLQFTHPPVNY